MKEVTNRGWFVVFIALTLLSCGSEEGVETLVETSPSLALAISNCTPGVPCPILTYAYASCLDLTPIAPDTPLGVFDAQQGGVATWITIVVANAPEAHPYVQLELFTDEMPLNFKEDKGPNTLKVPFLPLSDGSIRYQDQYMIQFVEPCCADDFEGMEATLRITVKYPDIDEVVSEWPVTLEARPWPLDDESALLEQCSCDAWPLERDDSLCTP